MLIRSVPVMVENCQFFNRKTRKTHLMVGYSIFKIQCFMNAIMTPSSGSTKSGIGENL